MLCSSRSCLTTVPGAPRSGAPRSATRCVPRSATRPRAVHHDNANPSAHGIGYHHPQDQHRGYSFFSPPLALLGFGALAGAADEIKKHAFKKALIVTDKVLVKVGAVATLTHLLDSVGVAYVIYDQCEPNPTDVQVHKGVELLLSNQCDFIVSFGGGSPHDAAKAIGIVATNGGMIHDYEGVNKLRVPMMPLIAFNTTAGTASEMTRFAIITDTKRHIKMAIIDARVTPMMAVNDPSLHMGMPKGLTAATGMDALTHAIEAYVSVISTPITDACALYAITLIMEYLVDAVEEGKDPMARDMMANAEYLAGMAFNSASLGYVHAIAHQLGGQYNSAHGVTNAILLPAVCEFVGETKPDLFVDIAKAMRIDVDVVNGVDRNEDAVKKVVAKIREISKKIGIPSSIRELGAKEEDFDMLAANALKDACGFTSPRKATHGDIVAILRKSF